MQIKLVAKTSNGKNIPKVLTQRTFTQAVRRLADRDVDLARIIREFGPPPMWEREPGFHTLVHIILEQQVSLASAKASYNRLIMAVSPLTPEGFLRLGDAELRAIGFSRQKTEYCRNLAQAITQGELDIPGLNLMDDESARFELMKTKGIGGWTADIYLLMALRRPDIWPKGDLALSLAVREVKGLDGKQAAERLDDITESWRPWRAVAARILWHYYLRSKAPRTHLQPTPYSVRYVVASTRS